MNRKIFFRINCKKRKILYLNALICVPYTINYKIYLQKFGDKIPFAPSYIKSKTIAAYKY